MPRRFSTVLPDEITIVHQGDNQTLCFWVTPVIQDHPTGLNIWFKLKPNNKSTLNVCNSHNKCGQIWYINHQGLIYIYKISQDYNFFNIKEHTQKQRYKARLRQVKGGKFSFSHNPSDSFYFFISVYITCLLVMSFRNLKLRKSKALKNTF